MPIYHGSDQITTLYHGSDAIRRVYHGSTLVFDTGGADTTAIGADGATVPFLGDATCPSAFYDATGNRTWKAFEGWDGSQRVVYVQTYDHTNERWEKRYKIANSPLTNDDHGAPAICMDGDGYVHCFFGSHISETKYSVTANSRDPSIWETRQDIDTTGTYPHPVYVNSALYLFLRTNDGTGDVYWTRRKATVNSGVASWGTPQNVAYFANSRFYQSTAIVDGTDIHFVSTASDHSDTVRSNVYHWIYDTTDDSAGNYDGSVSTAVGSQPVTKTTADTSYRVASPAITDVPAFCITPDGTRHYAYIDDSASPYDIKYMNDTGSGLSAATTVTTTTGSNAGLGYIEEIALIARSDNSVELWYPDDSASFTAGGDMNRIVRSSGGTWGSEGTILAADAHGIARPAPVRDANANLYIFFTEVAADSLDASAGDLQFWGYGAKGFRPGTKPAFISGPTISGPSGFYGTGDVLSVDMEHSGTSETYQWKRDGSAITGETNATYTLAVADEGTTITVTVTATNHVGSTDATSPGVSAVATAFSTENLTLSDASNLTLSDATALTISNRTA